MVPFPFSLPIPIHYHYLKVPSENHCPKEGGQIQLLPKPLYFVEADPFSSSKTSFLFDQFDHPNGNHHPNRHCRIFHVKIQKYF
jgi:hypothetical protein